MTEDPKTVDHRVFDRKYTMLLRDFKASCFRKKIDWYDQFKAIMWMVRDYCDESMDPVLAWNNLIEFAESNRVKAKKKVLNDVQSDVV